jgi:hypothetical protein
LPRIVIVELLAPLLLLGLGQQQGGGPEDAAAFLYWLMHQPDRRPKQFKPRRRHLKRSQTLKLVKMLWALQQARIFSTYNLS